jgi:hypothetical protein
MKNILEFFDKIGEKPRAEQAETLLEVQKNWDKFDDKGNFFLVNCMLLLIATGIMFLLLKRLNQAFKES